MKISDLVAHRNTLQDLDIATVQNQAVLDLSKVTQCVTDSHFEIPCLLHNDLEKIKQGYQQFSTNLQVYIDLINAEIKKQEPKYLQASWNFFVDELDAKDQNVLSRTISISSDLEKTLSTRLGLHTSWQTPGLIIRPGREQWIKKLVPLDPLYLVDVSDDLLLPGLDDFPMQYRNRVRRYTMCEDHTAEILVGLPKNQFGVCFVYNHFNFRPWEIIQKYLEEIYVLLRPGGVLIMTYNDCDHQHGAMLAESGAAPYTPGHWILNRAQQIGYTLLFKTDDSNMFTWVELKKPGSVSSIRGGQTLAKIVAT
jgi:SAM-dependent methyltransferase